MLFLFLCPLLSWHALKLLLRFARIAAVPAVVSLGIAGVAAPAIPKEYPTSTLGMGANLGRRGGLFQGLPGSVGGFVAKSGGVSCAVWLFSLSSQVENKKIYEPYRT